MEQIIPPGVDVDAIVEELRSGERGFVVVPGLFAAEEIAEARERILALIDSQGEKATHFQVAGVLYKMSQTCMDDDLSHGRARTRMGRVNR